MVPLIKRLEQLTPHPSHDTTNDNTDDDDDDDDIHPTECFLQYLDIPEDDSVDIDLQQTAVVIMAHLDRLARPLCPSNVDTRYYEYIG